MRLLDDRFAVVPHDPLGEKKAAGKIELPPDIRERMEREAGPKYVYGKVVAAGEGKRLDSGQRRPMEVAVGDVVLHYRDSGFPTKDAEGREIRVLNESDVILVW